MKRAMAAAAALLLMIMAGTVDAAPIVIKFSHIVPEQTPKGRMAMRFKELVEKRLAGKVKVEVYPEAKLFKDEDVLQAMLRGEVQMAAPSLSKFGAYTNKYDLFDLPFLFNDLAAVDRFQKGPAGQSLLMAMSDKGLVGLGYLHNGMKQMSANKPLRLPGDANGLKFRIQASDVLKAQFDVVGATAVKAPLGEVYGLLESRKVDGTENPWSNIWSQKFHQVQGTIMESDHGVLDYLVVTSDKFWNGLPAAIRTEVKIALDEAIVYGNEVALKQAMEDRQKVIDSGKCQVLPLTLSERAQWVSAMVPVWNRFEANVGPELVQAALEANRGKKAKRKRLY